MGYNLASARGVAHSSRLRHITGLADTYTAFILAARASGATLERWYGEDECARRWGAHTRPDAYLRWRHGTTVLRAFVEYDTGSETLNRVAAKFKGYARLAHALDRPCPVLIPTSTDGREQALARTLKQASTPATPVWLTTHSLLHDPGPAEPVWTDPHLSPRRTTTELAPPA